MADLEFSSDFLFPSKHGSSSSSIKASTMKLKQPRTLTHRRTQSSSMHDFQAFFPLKQERVNYPTISVESAKRETPNSSSNDQWAKPEKTRTPSPSVKIISTYSTHKHKSITPDIRTSEPLFTFRNRKARTFVKILDAAIEYFKKDLGGDDKSEEIKEVRSDISMLQLRLNDTDNIYLTLLKDYGFITQQIEDFKSHNLNYKLHVKSLKSRNKSLEAKLKSYQKELKFLRNENEVLLMNIKSMTPTPSHKSISAHKTRLSSLQVSSAEASEDELASIAYKIKRTEQEIKSLQRRFSEMVQSRGTSSSKHFLGRSGSRKFSVE